MDNNYFYTKDINYNLNRKIKQLNKGCEKLIEEQKKYINYYKNKKIVNNENNTGKDENRKGIKSSGSNQGKVLNEEYSLPNVKGFHKPDPIKSYVYRMNQYKDEIDETKTKIAQCYLLSLGHSLPLGHDSRKYQNYYCTKTRNAFTNNYIKR